MIDKTLISNLIYEGREKINKKLIEREELKPAKKYMDYKEVTTISGIRRSGKTYLMYLLMKHLIDNKVPEENIFYINFEDERLIFLETKDLESIYQTLLEHSTGKGKIYLFLDEIQNISGWEKWIARMYEKNIKFVVSGSNASLLSSEFSTALTGRNVLLEMFPFSFKELVKLQIGSIDIEKVKRLTEKRAEIRRMFKDYVKKGGFPEVVLEDKEDVLHQYYRDILYRDVVTRYNIKRIEALEKLAFYLLTNISAHTSFYNLRKTLGININTIKNYLVYLERAYLVARVPLFSYSVKKQIYNPFKIYCIDIGLRNSIAFKFSEEFGKLAENIAYTELKRRNGEVYYWRGSHGKEVDFLIKEGLEIKQLIQVCWAIDDDKTKRQEITGLVSGMETFNLNEGLILTDDYEGEEVIGNKKIVYEPLWSWLLT